MRRKMTKWFCAVSMLAAAVGPAWADAIVEAVQMPTWLERGDRADPLLPGQRIRDGDHVRTGVGARAYLRLADGSTVKLGESALLTSYQTARKDSVFRAAFKLATGAFRFTTAAVEKLRKRDVAIRVGTATIGIRGTDVWGRSGANEDFVMLIEGQVEVRAAQGEAIRLTEPLAVFTAPKGGAANPVIRATPEELQARALETEIGPGDGAATRHGKLKLVLGRFDSEEQALAVYDQVRAAGYGAKIAVFAAEGGYRYEVALHGFATKAETAAVAARLRGAGIAVTR